MQPVELQCLLDQLFQALLAHLPVQSLLRLLLLSLLEVLPRLLELRLQVELLRLNQLLLLFELRWLRLELPGHLLLLMLQQLRRIHSAGTE